MEKKDIVKRSFDFAVRVVKLCKELDKSPGINRTLSQQILRSGTSIGANVEEAQGGQSKADFISKCTIALKEARETNYWLRLLVASDIIPKAKLDPIIDESEQISKILAQIIISAKGSAK